MHDDIKAHTTHTDYSYIEQSSQTYKNQPTQNKCKQIKIIFKLSQNELR